MFKPTNILQKSQARLRGQRGPAIRILRKAIRTVNPDAVKPAMLMPEHAKSPTTAWKELGTPIDKVMPEYNRGRQLPEFARDPNSEQQQGLLSWQSAAQKDLAIMRQSSDGNVPAVIKQKEQRIEVPFAAQGRVSSSYPAGYKAPPTLHWNHSVYAFNKNTLPLIPATSTTARRMIRLYYNMIPRNFKDVLGPQVRSLSFVYG
ncbi:MAG: hypothetical protein M1820_009554 [Bogoriella megaspora]|nr:MAG: hypothetical protein M1820_009554 [Bogoriella megaspora]